MSVASSAISSAVTMGLVVVGASAGIGCSLGLIDVVFAMGAVIGVGSSAMLTGATGSLTGAVGALAGELVGAPPLRDSKSGHQLFSTS